MRHPQSERRANFSQGPNNMLRHCLTIAFLGIFGISAALGAEDAGKNNAGGKNASEKPVVTPEKLAKAVEILRRIDDIANMTDAEKAAKIKEGEEAWKTLLDAGAPGADTVKNELRKIEIAKKQDDYFKLGASEILWRIGKADQAAAIAALWSGDIDLADGYAYVFTTAFEAAATQDPRVLPILLALLRDQKGKTSDTQHTMTIAWPTSHLFVWGSYGSKGAPALMQAIDESKDDTTRASAIFLLARTQDLDALKKIRELALHGAGAVRAEAVKALGVYGHPQDFDFLLAGLDSKDSEDAWNFAYALYEYEDLRAVPRLIPLLGAKNERLANEVVASLSHLLTPEGLEAIRLCGEDTSVSAERRQACKEVVAGALERLNLTQEAYAAKSLKEKTELIASVRESLQEKYRPKSDDKKFTHDDLLKAAAEWKKNKQIGKGDYSWVEERHVMSAAGAKDIPLLLDAAAACYQRLTEDCLYETQALERLAQRLSRVRYRAEPGLCEKVVPPESEKPADSDN
jgi:hypothetical protein